MSDTSIQFFDMEGLTVIFTFCSVIMMQNISTHDIDGPIHAQAFSPHNNGNIVGLAVGRSLMCLDSRTMKDGITVEKAHPHRTLHLDFNPNLQHW